MFTMSSLTQALSDQHLFVAGQTVTKAGEFFESDGTVILISPKEPRFWVHFKSSPQNQDAQPDPMDRWSKATLDPIAAAHGCTPIYPSDGPPYPPFFSWALRTGQIWSSPISFLVHAKAGLFTSFRGALFVPEVMLPAEDTPKPCDTCAKPCATACPVDAFADGYDVAACKTYLHTDAGVDCMKNGCKARRACPVGQGLRIPEQAQFHMEAFR